MKVLLVRERKGLPERTNSMFKRVKVGYNVVSVGYGLSCGLVVSQSSYHLVL